MPSVRERLLSRIPCLCLVLGLLSTGRACFGQSTEPAEQSLPPKVMDLLEKQVGMDDNLPGEKNPSGLRFQFTKIGESNLEQGRFTSYRAYVPGAAENRKYAVAIWKIGQDPQVLPVDVYVNAKGLLMTKKPRPDQENVDSVDGEDEVDFSVQAARGEPLRVMLATADGSFLVPGTLVPFPVLGADRKCRLEARLAMPEGEAVLIYADGLPPNVDVPFKSVSEGELHTGMLHTNAHGHAANIDLPYVTGKDAGVLKFTVQAKDCSASVGITWGKGTYHPL